MRAPEPGNIFTVGGITYKVLAEFGGTGTAQVGDGLNPAVSTATTVGLFAIPSSAALNGVVYSVKGIGGYAFYTCRGITSVTIPDTVQSIGGSAFEECRGLANVVIPDGLTSIGSYAFSWCYSLKSTIIPDSVMSIGDHAFLYSANAVIYSSVEAYAHTYAILNQEYPAPTPISPVITAPSGPLTSGSVGTQYSVTITADNLPTSFHIFSGSLPSGLSISGSGVISGTPTTIGTSNFTVIASNEAGSSEPVVFSIDIEEPAPANTPKVTVSSASGEAGSKVTLTVSLENNPDISNSGLTMKYDNAPALRR